MNCLIFHNDAEARQLPRYDSRAKHLLKVLGLEVGDAFTGAVIDRYKGRFLLEAITADSLQFRCLTKETDGDEALPAMARVQLAIGYCRPLILKRVFRDGAAMGLRDFTVFPTALADPSYAKSGYIAEGRYREQFIAGIEQSGGFRLPTLTQAGGLEPLLTAPQGTAIVALDRLPQLHTPLATSGNTYHNHYLSDWLAGLDRPVALRVIVGSERGFAPEERQRLLAAASEDQRVTICRLGPQLVRADTAALAAVSSIWQRFAALTES